MSVPKTELDEAMRKCRAKLRGHLVGPSIISIARGRDPNGRSTAEGIIILYNEATPTGVVESIRQLAHETAPNVPVYLHPEPPPRPLGLAPADTS